MSSSAKKREKDLRLLRLSQQRAGTRLNADRVMNRGCRCRLCVQLGAVPGVYHPEEADSE